MLYTVQHSNTIKVFLSINEEETKPFLNTQENTVVCNQTIYDLPIFSLKNVKNKQKLTF